MHLFHLEKIRLEHLHFQNLHQILLHQYDLLEYDDRKLLERFIKLGATKTHIAYS